MLAVWTLAAAAQLDVPPALPTTRTPLILDQNRLDRTPDPTEAPRETKPAPRTAPTGGARVEGADAGVQINSVSFGGAKVPARVANAARPYLGKRATREVLGDLAKALSDAYADADIALYTVIIPDQSFAKGVVVVRVAEGFVERVVFTGGMTPLMKAYATQLTREHPLSKRALQRYLSLMRDIPGEKVDVQVLRGTKPGGIVLQIKGARKHTDFSVSYDNRGQDQQGNSQVRADAHAYSLLRDGDRTDLTGLITPNVNRLRYISLAHGTPIGTDGGQLSLSVGYLATHAKRTDFDGTAKTAGITYSYPIIRGYTKNLVASIGVDGIDSDQAILGAVASADHTRALRGALGFSIVKTRSVITAGLTVSRGLDILSAHGTPFLSEPVFTKVNARASYDRQIGKTFVVRTKGQLQYSKDPLPAGERIVIGGADYGRAFDQAVVSGDRGYAVLGELAFRPKLGAKLQGSELYGFTDHAKVRFVDRLPYYRGANFDVGSAGGGVRIAFTPRAWLELEGARVIDKPYPGYQGKWRFNVSWRLQLKKS
ncbi:ShlB/FhaC/HecB family hemolysin secretion/activation protein [Sphingomonas sp. AP4-R1]|uniref:ShlB/FhaC/HecB family hemolysin secretion/activation protein n=1 Tax=Sphingomonas sp. AP4-R1 TaxID=2735134 RepID=UPI001493D926|nr:ShlB/FhaC/HecB family hemolysin secretion/activation protein [Sphingomonas sp. AP4-R1]QJU59543.1 ShlB/FhaC/HecB family hemolysin secretion/activation protein [Sphingomonas sp. AP4-R1]